MKILIAILTILLISSANADHRGENHTHEPGSRQGYYYHGGTPKRSKGPVGTYQRRFNAQENYGYDYTPYQLKDTRKNPGYVPYGTGPKR